MGYILKTVEHPTEKHITSLNMNGLRGRMLAMPGKGDKKSREILLLYGHHASLERMFGFAEVLNRYGTVTMPDLPGFGGMQSFYSIGEKPTLDNYADYLASFIKLRYKRKKVVIVAMSFSVPLVVRTLQRYPELSRKVDLFVSTVGFVHKSDFIFTKKTYWGLQALAWFGSLRIPSLFISTFILQPPIIKLAYTLVADRHTKLQDANETERAKRIKFETKLWKINDLRTRMATIRMMLGIDVCDRQVPVKTLHIAPQIDRYFDAHVVEQHMRVIFEDLTYIPTTLPAHAPSIIARAKDAAPYIPPKAQRILRSLK